MIELNNVQKIFNTAHNAVTALHNISVKISAGELVAITGPSGSGKSTLMHILGLLDVPSQGKYFLDGVDTSSFLDDARAEFRNQRLGFVFQNFFLLPRLSALDNVLLPLQYSNSMMSLDEQKEKAMSMLKKVGMENRSTHRPSELSGGQQQRVAIARALVNNPSVILADEPTGALDSATGDQVMRVLTDEMQAMQKTVLIITHSPDIAARCARQIRIRDGKIDHDFS